MSSLNSLPSANEVEGRLCFQSRVSQCVLNVFTGVVPVTIDSDVIGMEPLFPVDLALWIPYLHRDPNYNTT